MQLRYGLGVGGRLTRQIVARQSGPCLGGLPHCAMTFPHASPAVGRVSRLRRGGSAGHPLWYRPVRRDVRQKSILARPVFPAPVSVSAHRSTALEKRLSRLFSGARRTRQEMRARSSCSPVLKRSRERAAVSGPRSDFTPVLMPRPAKTIELELCPTFRGRGRDFLAVSSIRLTDRTVLLSSDELRGECGRPACQKRISAIVG
jgi:hypothetical protein